MPKAKSTTKDLSVKELREQIVEHKKMNCPALPKKKDELKALAVRLGLPVEKKRVASAPKARKPRKPRVPKVKTERKPVMVRMPNEFGIQEFPEGF
jgi:hypothetical protein